MKPRHKLSSKEITEKLYSNESHHKAFLNPKIIKKEQVVRMIQRAIDKYSNFYEQRSASRERSQKKVQSNKENSNISNKKIDVVPRQQEMSAEKLVKSLQMQEKKANVPKKERQV